MSALPATVEEVGDVHAWLPLHAAPDPSDSKSVPVSQRARYGSKQTSAMLEERARIADELNDSVIRGLFAAGMGLQGLLIFPLDDHVRSKVEAVIDGLDETMKEMRAAIFSLRLADPTYCGNRSPFST